MTKIISVIGDSHTWGEGVGGEYSFNPSVCPGELRMLPFGNPGYVNLLRHAVNLSTGSSAKEYCGKKLHALCEEAPDDFGYFRTLVLDETFSCLRIFFRLGTADASVQVYIDDELTDTVFLGAEEQTMNRCIKAYFCRARDDGKHTLRLVGADGAKIGVHRIECYSGPYAVINCGVGSCPVTRYTNECFERYAAPLDPWMIVFEGCTINDWLTRETTDEYAAALRRLLALMRNYTDKIVWHTVSPICGEQKTSEDAQPYDAYIETMRQVARENSLPLVDCNRLMKEALTSVNPDRHAQMLFHDRWHPNGTGHYLYAESIFEVIGKML